MPKARHLRDWPGSPDGNTVIRYRAGEVDDLTPRLYSVALEEGWAEPFEERAVPAPENKATAPTENKARPRRRKTKIPE